MKKKCNCKHEGQDKIHGKGIRVMNQCAEGKRVRCTVCGSEHAKGSKSE